MKFEEFKTGPARSVMRGLGGVWGGCLENATSYGAFRYLVVEMNDPNKGNFRKAVKKYAQVCSSGEYRLLLGICLLTDFPHVADALSRSQTWEIIRTGMDDDFRRALAACVVNAGP
jgi:hypothetical protein